MKDRRIAAATRTARLSKLRPTMKGPGKRFGSQILLCPGVRAPSNGNFTNRTRYIKRPLTEMFANPLVVGRSLLSRAVRVPINANFVKPHAKSQRFHPLLFQLPNEPIQAMLDPLVPQHLGRHCAQILLQQGPTPLFQLFER
jgi:hypothetical protein